MTSVSRRFLLILMILAFSGLAYALIGQSKVQGAVAARELNVYLGPSALNLDPHHMETALSMTVVMQLHRGLLRFDANGDCVPDIAKSWEASKDHKNYRFKLRESYFSNGERITSRHVLYSFARVFVLETGMAADIEYIAGVKEFQRTKKIEALGLRVISDDVIEFKLAAPSAIFLKHLAVADLAVMPFTSLVGIEQAPKAFSGPYKPVAALPDGNFSQDVVELVKWRADHLESSRPPERIRFLNAEANPVELALNGENDSLDAIPVAKEMRARLEAKGWGVAPTEITKERFIVLNANKLSFELRRFLASRIHQDELLKRLDEPGFKAAYGLIPNGFPGALAVSDLKDHGQVVDYTGPKVKIEFDYNTGVALDAKIAAYVKEAWAHDRVEVVLNPLPPKTRLAKLLSRQADTALGIKGIDYPDGYSVLTYFKGKYEVNFFFIDDPVIDAKISSSVSEFDAAKRTELYRDIQRDVLKFKTVVPLVFGSEASGLWSQKIKNAPSHPMGLHTMPFETIEMQDE